MKRFSFFHFLFLILFVMVVSGNCSKAQQIPERDTLIIEGIDVDLENTNSGIEIWRSNSPGLKVWGQFGCTGDFSGWKPKAGQAVYRFETLADGSQPPVVRIIYSKYSEPVVVKLTLDDQVRYFTPENQGNWNEFTVIKCTFKKPMIKGKHVLKFYTDGVQYGVMDIARIIIIC